MDEQKVLQIANLIMKDVFGRENPLSLAQMERLLTKDITLPTVLPCARTGESVHIYNPQPSHKPLSETAYKTQAQIDDWMRPAQPLNSINDFLKAWDEVNYMNSDKAVESQNVAKSDSILSSDSVYMSTMIGSSKNILFSHNSFFSNYLLACRGNSSSNFGIRLFDNIYCSSSYEVWWSNKVSRSMFITDCLDLYECIGCFGIRSKKYCIANMQYEKDEYMRIKEMIIDWIFAEWQKA